jgi:hypothetical protein
MATDATLDHLERDEALDIGAELGEIFGRRAGAVLLQRTIDSNSKSIPLPDFRPTFVFRFPGVAWI